MSKMEQIDRLGGVGRSRRRYAAGAGGGSGAACRAGDKPDGGTYLSYRSYWEPETMQFYHL